MNSGPTSPRTGQPDTAPDVPDVRLVSLPRRMARAWDRFWFTPADPTLLGLIRIGCGLIVVYVLLVYSFDLQELFGREAWYTLQLRLGMVREAPVYVEPLFPQDVIYEKPQTPEQQEYASRYFERWKEFPPPPYPKSAAEAERYNHLRELWGFDPRRFKMPLPENTWQENYVRDYRKKWGDPPPPPYPQDEAEAVYFDQYRLKWGYDPRILYARGSAITSIWFHVTDPTWMAGIHATLILIAILFTAGFATRITSVLTWAAMLSYIHRAPSSLFGQDTMMNIVLIYLMIGPSGAALSLDRLIAKWWARRRGGPKPPAEPVPRVSANVAIRLLQIHVCFIYAGAGFSKLHGTTWWDGTAVWSTLANYEFAPIQFPPYMAFLRYLGRNPLLWHIFMTTGTYFTLFFEITYAFLIWLRPTRWLLLAMAIVLHGFIGMFMGLKTFSLIMLVMNMAFLTPAEARALAGWLLYPFVGRAKAPAPRKPAPLQEEPRPVPVAAGAPVASGRIRRKK